MSTATPAKKDYLGPLLAELWRKAERTAKDHSLDLPKGLRIAVRHRAGQRMITMSRLGAAPGLQEELIVMRAAGVPASAERWPKEGTYPRAAFRPGIVGQDHQCVTYVWEVAP